MADELEAVAKGTPPGLAVPKRLSIDLETGICRTFHSEGKDAPETLHELPDNERADLIKVAAQRFAANGFGTKSELIAAFTAKIASFVPEEEDEE